MARAALDRLFKQSKEARATYEKAAGYAVFDNRKMSFMITTGFGAGVAVDKKSGKRTYMKMITGGVNLGMGAGMYQVIFLFPTQAALDNFVQNGWSADAEADAVGGKEGVGTAIRLANGTTVYELVDGGLALSATFTGTRYYRDDELNR